MAYTPIPKLTPDWDVPLNAALVDQDARITENDAGIDSLNTIVTSLDTRLDTAETDIDALEAADVALDGRLDTAEANITNLQGRMTTAETDINNLEAADVSLDGRLDTAESNITTLQGQMTTANSNITNLQGRMTTAETDINNLEAADVSLDTRLDTAESDILDLALGFNPDDYGLLTWTQDPATSIIANALTSGVTSYSLIKVTKPITVTSVMYCFSGTAPSGATANQCFIAIYNMSGTRVAVSADQSGVWNSTGNKTTNLTSPTALPVGYYYVAILFNGTTAPTMMNGGNNFATGMNINLGTNRSAVSAGGQTSTPASITIGSLTAHGYLRWFGFK